MLITKRSSVKGSVLPLLPLSEPHLLRERQVLMHFPISRSELWNRVREGRFPAPVKLSPKVSAWRSQDVLRVLEEYGVEAVA